MTTKKVTKKSVVTTDKVPEGATLGGCTNQAPAVNNTWARQDCLRMALDTFRQPENLREATPTNIINLAYLFEKYITMGYQSVVPPQEVSPTTAA